MTTEAKSLMRRAVEERGGLCAIGSSTDEPCRRQATERRWPEDEEPTICREHALLFELDERAEEMNGDLETLHAWIAQLLVPGGRGLGDRIDLERRLRDTLETLIRDYVALKIRQRGAEIIADQRPQDGKPYLLPEESEDLARFTMVSDAYTNAIRVLEDLPADVFGAYDKWLVIGAVALAKEGVKEEAPHIRAKFEDARPR